MRWLMGMAALLAVVIGSGCDPSATLTYRFDGLVPIEGRLTPVRITAVVDENPAEAPVTPSRAEYMLVDATIVIQGEGEFDVPGVLRVVDNAVNAIDVFVDAFQLELFIEDDLSLVVNLVALGRNVFDSLDPPCSLALADFSPRPETLRLPVDLRRPILEIVGEGQRFAGVLLAPAGGEPIVQLRAGDAIPRCGTTPMLPR